jgi:hypothetical protein
MAKISPLNDARESCRATRWGRTYLRLVHLQGGIQHVLHITFVSEDCFHAANA